MTATTGHPPGLKGGLSEGQKRRIVNLYKDGKTVAFICTAIGVGLGQAKHVKNILREAGIYIEKNYGRKN